MKKFSCDFETTTIENDARVWAYAICEIGCESEVIYGNSIEDFIKICSKKDENNIYFFHNLKFDGSYILSYLLLNGYKWIKDKKEKADKTFTTLISDMGQFYSIEVFFKVGKKKVNKAIFYDSLKLIPFSVEDIAKKFKLKENEEDLRKLKLDYKEFREKGHILTDEEKEYIKHDVIIVSKALNILFKEDLTKMTIGSNALTNYKASINGNFDNYFPEPSLEEDTEIRETYKGGWTYLNPKYEGKEVKDGLVIDKNSMYPYHLRNSLLPFGEAVRFEGEYKFNKMYPLYTQVITCSFELKNNKLPSIQLKNNLNFLPTEYIESSKGELITLHLTSIDLCLFKEQYNIYDISYDGGYMFKGMKGLFNSYIDYWGNIKIEAGKTGNFGLRQVAKLMLNSLYGKFGLSPYARSKMPYLENEVLKFKILEKEERKKVYVPIASFITSYARRDIIETSQKLRDYTMQKYNDDYYIYSDTDSCHIKYISDEELKTIIDIDEFRLGAYKVESRFKRGKYIRQKCYIEEDYEGKLNTTIAGLPKRLGKYVNFRNFKKGMQILADDNRKENKLRYKQVKGGVILVNTDFSIK